MPNSRKKKKPTKIKVWLLKKNGIPQRYTIRSTRVDAKRRANFLPSQKAKAIVKGLRLQKAAKKAAKTAEQRKQKTARRAPRERAPPGAPEVRQVSAPTSRKGATYSTWFKAMGTMGTAADLKDPYLSNLLTEDLEEFSAPAQFYSNQSGLLGQVRWKGNIPLEILIDKLNVQLQYIGDESPDFDFRSAYWRWSYKYQVIESLGPTDRVVFSSEDSKPKRGR